MTLLKTGKLLQKWQQWESELYVMNHVCLPRCYTISDIDPSESTRQLHVFCDASERVYGSVAYLKTESRDGKSCVAFVAARSRVAPMKCVSMPRLELSAALIGAQLADTISKEITMPIESVTLWSDSTTVLSWLQSDSCRYKVFVGTRVSEIQDLSDIQNWKYVKTEDNPADDLTRGKTLTELCAPSRWRDGPSFLSKETDQWPKQTCSKPSVCTSELRKSFCGNIQTRDETNEEHNHWKSLVDATKTLRNGAATNEQCDAVTELENVENQLYRCVQIECFPEETTSLKNGKTVSSNSRLIQLDPEYDEQTDLIRVGGRLRRADGLSDSTKHPIVLDPKHHITKLLIKDYDEKLHHYGGERLFAEIRRKFWILRGREAIRNHQRQCVECQRWRANPNIPKMSDLPCARLQLFKPPFYSTGVDCFGPMYVKVGRRREKRFGVIFKCLTTRSVHLDILESMDTDSFLMALRRFVSRRGKTFELLSDCGTNFKGGESELTAEFQSMNPKLAELLTDQKIGFRFNPP
jgi:hypothetical protein